jgi:multisubunit Na+/H+ antiporter MnhB subunit
MSPGHDAAETRERDLGLLLAILLALIGALLLWVFYAAVTAEVGPRLAELALDNVPRSGVSNPVTSVLLNYRAYDTLMELAVLLTALIGIWSLGPAAPPYQQAGLALEGMVTWIVPLLILTGGYMLWVGGHAPGGAFQAGALLGAAGVIVRLSGDGSAGLPGGAGQRWLIIAGILTFSLVGVALSWLGPGFLHYPLGAAKWLILLIETAATIAIGATLAAAYVGGRPNPGEGIDDATRPARTADRSAARPRPGS